MSAPLRPHLRAAASVIAAGAGEVRAAYYAGKKWLHKVVLWITAGQAGMDVECVEEGVVCATRSTRWGTPADPIYDVVVTLQPQ